MCPRCCAPPPSLFRCVNSQPPKPHNPQLPLSTHTHASREKAEAASGAPAAAPAADADAAPELVGPKTDLSDAAKRLRRQASKEYDSATKNRPSLPAAKTEPENEVRPGGGREGRGGGQGGRGRSARVRAS